MPQSFSIRPGAVAEMQEAYRWYEECQPGLGSDFTRCVEACLELIRRHPEIFPAVHRDIRQGLIRRFPYSIYYLPTKDSIIVLSIFHVSREPTKWRRNEHSI
jgi:plasmid stabilization system protein ParE